MYMFQMLRNELQMGVDRGRQDCVSGPGGFPASSAATRGEFLHRSSFLTGVEEVCSCDTGGVYG
jgi:hypothetical protein